MLNIEEIKINNVEQFSKTERDSPCQNFNLDKISNKFFYENIINKKLF